MKRRNSLHSISLALGTLLLVTMPIIVGMPTAGETPSAAEKPAAQKVVSTNQEATSEKEPVEKKLETVKLLEQEIGYKGNWIKKKNWLLKAYEISDQIREQAGQIQGIRKSFNEKYNTIDDELDEFYKELGLEQGKLQKLFDSLMKYLNKKKKKKQEKLAKKKEEYTISDREYVVKIEIVEEKIKAHKRQLDQLKLDMKSIEDLDKSLSKRLEKLDEQIKQAIDISSKTKELTSKLWNIIDDNKARAIYFNLKGDVLERLKSIDEYLKNKLYQDFNKVGDSIRTQITKVRQGVKILEKKGLIIQKRAKRLEVIKLQALREADETAKKAPIEKARPKPKIKKIETWYEKIYNSITSFVAKFYDYVTDLYHKNLSNKNLNKKLKQIQKKPLIPTQAVNKALQAR